MRYVNVYLADRAYGGPEEGGWWYDCGEAIRSFPCYTHRRAERVLLRVRRIVERANVGRRPKSSVLSTGVYECWIEDHPARDYPACRPHYE